LGGCLVTQTRKIEIHTDRSGDPAAVISSDRCVQKNVSDEEYFRDGGTVRWPDGWKQRHPQKAAPQPGSGKSHEGELY